MKVKTISPSNKLQNMDNTNSQTHTLTDTYSQTGTNN